MPKRILEGKVVSTKQDKTATVLVERRFMHPVYKKYVKRTDKYAAHDENNSVQEGDLVQIEECRPISKRKTWTLIQGGAADSDNKATTPKSETKKDDKKETKAEAAPKKKAAPKAKKEETKKDSKKKA